METDKTITATSEAARPSVATGAVHMIGVGGSGMSALARMLLDRGTAVSGSDMKPSGALDSLTRSGATIHIGQGGSGEDIPHNCTLVVHSAAIHEQNPELLAARRRGLEVVKYSQMLGRLMAQRVGMAVAGTHGKSTTTAMVAYALSAAGADPSFIVGADVPQLGGPSGAGAGKLFVAEACEYDRSFLNLRPHYAAILNLEEDHLDCFADLEAIVEAFRSFASLVSTDGVLVVNGEDPEAVRAAAGASCAVETFGFAESCLWRSANETLHDGCFRMEVMRGDSRLCELTLSLPGRHNAYNALAAAALLHHAGLDGEAIATHLGNFAGADRRLTLKDCRRGVTIVDDFAHHPTEISATLRAIVERYRPRRLLCVFQPHQHSRTRFLLKDFARSFTAADEIIVPDIYFVRDSDREKDYISSQDLVSQIRLNGGTAAYYKTFDEIVNHLRRTLQEGDLLVTMGAGNIWEVSDELVRWLREDS